MNLIDVTTVLYTQFSYFEILVGKLTFFFSLYSNDKIRHYLALAANISACGPQVNDFLRRFFLMKFYHKCYVFKIVIKGF